MGLSVADLSPGMTIEYGGKLYKIVDYEHSKRGRGDAFARTKIKDLKTGKVFSRTFKGSEEVNKAYLEERSLQFLYRSGEALHFMDEKNYEQFQIVEQQLGDKVNYLTENVTVTGLFHEGKLVTINLPTFVNLTIEDTRPGVKGDTASGGTKPATVESGLQVKVPLFIKQGEKIKIDTRSGEYVERA